MKRKIALIATIAVLSLLFAIGIGISAAGEASVAIKYGNLSYIDGSVTLEYAVKYEGIAETAEHGLLVWRDPAKHFLKGREDMKILSGEKVEINGESYYRFSLEGIGERELTDDIYTVAYARVGTRIYYSEVNKHSPLRYSYIAEGKIGDTPIDDEEFLAVLSEMITNGAEAQRREAYMTDRLADAEYVELRLVDGSFVDGTSVALLPAGSTASVVGKDSGGEVLSDWINEAGESVSAGSSGSVRAPSENATFTARYVKADTGIEYVLGANDARFTETPPSSDTFGESLDLPIPMHSGYEFAGWYTDRDFDPTSAVSVIPAGSSGNIKLYASWSKRLYLDDYSTLSGVTIGGSSSSTMYTTSGGTKFRASNADGTEFYSDGKGIVWHTGSKGSDILVAPTGGLAGLMGSGNVVTLRIGMSSVEGRPIAASHIRLRAKGTSSEIIKIVNVASDGVYLGEDKNYKIATLDSELQYINIIVNFEAGEISAVSEDGYLLAKRGIEIPASSQYKDLLEWKKNMTYIINWYAGAASNNNAIRIGELSVYSGNYGLKSSERVTSSADLIARLEALMATNNAFTMERFSSVHSPMRPQSDSTMPAPVYDCAPELFARDDGTGARLMLNESMIAGIIATLEDERYSVAYSTIIQMANSDEDGVLGTPAADFGGRKGLHNFDYSVLATLEAKALMYRVLYEQDLAEGSYDAYSRDIYGYGAIVGIKNFLETLRIEYISSDQCREYGYAMFIAAEVYDWCYPLLSDKDKAEIKYAVLACCCTGTSIETSSQYTTMGGVKMEMGFPPSGQSSVAGHGAEAQVLRDYLAFALAIYDEDPTWWNYVAGRVLGDFVPVRNYYFQSGLTQQGVSTYAIHRHYADLYSAWILQTATGKNPYVGLENTVRSIISGANSSEDVFFSAGDGPHSKAVSSSAKLALMSAALYDDETLFTWAHGYMNGFNTSGETGSTYITVSNMVIFVSQGMECVEDKYAELDVICYNPYPAGQMVTRYKWNDPNAASTFMKIGGRHTTNHEHEDAGTFQIYYKGLLTSDAGLYSNSSHEQTRYYHGATIGHNGILVFNPAKWDYSSGTAATKWYSGGQRRMSTPYSLGEWLSYEYETAELIGAQYGYKDEAETIADYAYLAGDITKAYDSDTVSYMTRSMLTVYNDQSSDHPMYFFVFDSIESTDASFKKTFLLHIRGLNEPTVNGNVITTTNGDGKLVVHSLTDGTKIAKVGGITYGANGKYDAEASQNCLINGHQIVASNKGNDGNWGRVEVITSGEKKSTFMHAMYVTDAKTTSAPTVKKISADGIEGAIIGDVAAVFRDSTERTLSEVKFRVNSSGEMRYYVAGLFEGTWNISVSGKSYGSTVIGEGGMAVFTAPAGTVTLTPGDDVMPKGGGHIFYETNGGTLPEDAVDVFAKGEEATLPTPTQGISEFAGWYTTPDFTGEALSRVPAGASGILKLYAKWNRIFFAEDFRGSDLALSGEGAKATVGGSYISIVDGEDAVADIRTDAKTGNKYLVISPAGGEITVGGTAASPVVSTGATSITYTLELATYTAAKSPKVVFNLKGARTVTLFTVDTRGDLYVNNKKVASLSTSLEKYSFTVDFKTCRMTVKDADGRILCSETVGDVTIGALESLLFEMRVIDGSEALSKHKLKVGSIEVRETE